MLSYKLVLWARYGSDSCWGGDLVLEELRTTPQDDERRSVFCRPSYSTPQILGVTFSRSRKRTSSNVNWRAHWLQYILTTTA